MSSVREEIMEIIMVSSKPRIPDLSDEDRSLFEVGINSLDYASAIMGIEEKYNLEISEEDVEGLTSLNDIIRFVERQLRKS